MAKQTQTKRPTNAQIVARLKRSKKGILASALGVTPAQLTRIPGVVVVGTERRPHRGRPPHLFGFDAKAAEQGA